MNMDTNWGKGRDKATVNTLAQKVPCILVVSLALLSSTTHGTGSLLEDRV